MVEDAALNNAEWCDAFCRTHGITGRFDETAWSSSERTPPYYPDAVTLSSGCSAERLLSRVDVGSGCSIKDSFADLDLSAHGFEVLFAAEWFRRARSRAGAESKRWSAVVGVHELDRWEAAWGEPPLPRPFFRSELLGDPRIRILGCFDGRRLRAGAIANRSRNVIGLGNVFAADDDLESALSGAASAACAEWGAMPVVSYGFGESLDAAHRAGFEAIGNLTVWAFAKPRRSSSPSSRDTSRAR